MLHKRATQSASAPTGLLITGTGSTYPLATFERWGQHIKSRTPLAFEKSNALERTRLDVRTAIEHLENIRNVLNPPISELATLFDVSRQAIYKWLAENFSPESDKLERIIELSKIADAFKKAGIHRAGALLHMKLFEGQSLFDLLKTRQLHETQVKELIVEALAIEASYQRSGLAQSNAESTSDWLSSASIPAYREEH